MRAKPGPREDEGPGLAMFRAPTPDAPFLGELFAEGRVVARTEGMQMTVNDPRFGPWIEQIDARDIVLLDLKLSAAGGAAPTALAGAAYSIAPRARRAHENVHEDSSKSGRGPELRPTTVLQFEVRESRSSISGVAPRCMSGRPSGPALSLPQLLSQSKPGAEGLPSWA
jgi:hypothetical protein